MDFTWFEVEEGVWLQNNVDIGVQPDEPEIPETNFDDALQVYVNP